jgi:hypothetical protein
VGRDVLLGYRRGDFLTFPLFSVLSLAPIVMSRKIQKIADVLANYDVLELESLRLTFGMLVIYSSLLGFVAFIGVTTEQSAVRYVAISNYCYSAAASS